MPHFLDGPGIHTEKAIIFSRENTKALQDRVANDIIRQSKWSLWNSGQRYHLVNKMENGCLTKIPEIVEYSKTCGYAEQFLKHLSNAIKGLKNPTQFSYPLNFGEVPCTFTIVVVEKTGYRVEMAIRIQFSDVH